MVQPQSNSYTNPEEIAAIYLRVSTTDQESNSSLQNQKDLAIEYAEKNGFKCDPDFIIQEVKPASRVEGKIVNESNLRESLRKRPGLQQLMSLADAHKFQHLIIYSIDRFSRNYDEYISLMVFFEKRKIKVHFTKPDEMYASSNDALNKLVEIVKANVAELEANTIASRVRAGNSARISDNLWAGGRVPFGFIQKRYDNKRTTIQKSDFEASIVKKVFELYAEGNGYRKIAQIMNKDFACMGWTKSKVEYIIKNKTYTGEIYWNRRSGRRKNYKFNDESSIVHSSPIRGALIIEPSKWDEVTKLRCDKVANPAGGNYYTTSYLLRGKLYCGLCEDELKTKNYGKGKKSVYRCPSCLQGKKSKLIIEKDIIEGRFIENMDKYINKNDLGELWETYITSFNDNRGSINEQLNIYSNKINEININIKKLSSLTQSLEAANTPEDDESCEEDEEDKEKKDTKNPDEYNEDDMIYSILMEELVRLKKLQECLKSKMDEFELSSKREPMFKDGFIQSVTNVLKDIKKLDTFQRRRFIDLCIDKIYAFPVGDNIELKIHFNAGSI